MIPGLLIIILFHIIIIISIIIIFYQIKKQLKIKITQIKSIKVITQVALFSIY